MKKSIALMLLVVVILSLTACGGQNKQVPDGFINLDVDEFMQGRSMGKTYIHSSVHSYDEEARLDDVTVEVRIPDTYADTVYTFTVTYLYNKSSDSWEKAAPIRWGGRFYDYKKDMIRKTFDGDIYGDKYTLTVTEVNLDTGTITCEYDLVYSKWEAVVVAKGTATFEVDYQHPIFYIPASEGDFQVEFSTERGFYISQWYPFDIS